MSTHPIYEARLNTQGGYGTLSIQLHDRHHAEKHFQDIAARILTDGTRMLHITETISAAHQQRTYRVAPSQDATG